MEIRRIAHNISNRLGQTRRRGLDGGGDGTALMSVSPLVPSASTDIYATTGFVPGRKPGPGRRRGPGRRVGFVGRVGDGAEEVVDILRREMTGAVARICAYQFAEKNTTNIGIERFIVDRKPP